MPAAAQLDCNFDTVPVTRKLLADDTWHHFARINPVAVLRPAIHLTVYSIDVDDRFVHPMMRQPQHFSNGQLVAVAPVVRLCTAPNHVYGDYDGPAEPMMLAFRSVDIRRSTRLVPVSVCANWTMSLANIHFEPLPANVSFVIGQHVVRI